MQNDDLKETELDELENEDVAAEKQEKIDNVSKLSLDKDDMKEVQAEEERSADAMLAVDADSISRTISEVVLQKRIFRVNFGREYDFGGKTYESIDLSGLDNLSTIQLQRVDRICERMSVSMDDKLNDTVWCKYIAMSATGLPVEFFNQLKARDMMEINGVIRVFFTLG